MTTTRRRRSQRGVALAELGIVSPLLLVLLLAVADLTRLITLRQEITDLCREAANLVSRGGTAADAITMTTQPGSVLADSAKSAIVVSRVMRRNQTDSTPWIIEQVSSGALAAERTIGSLNGAANLPAITSLESGVTVTAVELIRTFDPMFGLSGLGLSFYPSRVHDVAVF